MPTELAFLESLRIPGHKPRALELTPDMVSRCFRPEPDLGSNPEWTPITDDDRERLAESLLAGCNNNEVCIFGYGSLIWKPEFDKDPAMLGADLRKFLGDLLFPKEPFSPWPSLFQWNSNRVRGRI